MENLLKQLKQLAFHLVMNNNSKKKFLDETSFLLDKYQPTAFEMRLEKDTTSDYPRYYFGEACLCDPTGIPQVICKGKSYPLKKNDFVFDSLTMKCTYGKTRLVSVATYLPKSMTCKNLTSLQRS